MALYKNVASQKIAVFAYDTSAETPKTGDSANITAQISKDFGAAAATNDANPTELDATDHPGVYVFDLTQAETNANVILLSAVSATSNVQINPLQVFTTPPNFRAMVIDSSGRLDISKIEGSDATDQINAACDAAIETYGLDHLVFTSVTGTDVANDSIVAQLVSSSATADWDTYNNASDSQQAIRDQLIKVPASDGTVTWNATALASIQSECNDALVAQKLDHLVAVADSDDPVNNSIIAKLAATGGDWSTFVPSTDSLQALRDRGDVAYITATGFATAAELAKVPKSDGTVTWNATALASIQSECEDALETYRLDELLAADSDIDGAAPPTVGSVFFELMTKTTGSFTYNQTTDSLEALRDQGDAAYITATGFATAAELAKVPKSDGTVTWNATALASIQSEANDALVALHLDHLFAEDYDPNNKPGNAGAWANELVQGGDTGTGTGTGAGFLQFTADALELAGSGGGSAEVDLSSVLAILGTPTDLGSGATLADNLKDIESQTDDIGVAGAGLTAITNVLGTPTDLGSGDDLANNLVDIFNAIGGNALVMVETTIESVTTLATGTATGTAENPAIVLPESAAAPNDDAYLGCLAVFEDTDDAGTDPKAKGVAQVIGYQASTRTVYLRSTPPGFTIDAGDSITILAINPVVGVPFSAVEVIEDPDYVIAVRDGDLYFVGTTIVT